MKLSTKSIALLTTLSVSSALNYSQLVNAETINNTPTENRLMRVENEMVRMNERVSKLEENQSNFRKRLDALPKSDEFEAVKELANQNKAQLDIIKTELTGLKEKVSKNATDINALKQQLQADISRLDAKDKLLDQALDALTGRVGANEQAIKGLQGKVADIEKALKALDQKYADKTAQLQKELDELKPEITSLKDRMDKGEKRLDDLEKKMTDLTEKVNGIDQAIVDNIITRIPLKRLTPDEVKATQEVSGVDWNLMTEAVFEETKAHQQTGDPRFVKLQALFKDHPSEN